VTDLYKVQAVWSGLPGLPGVSTFYTMSVPTLSRYKAFFDAIVGAFPASIKVTVAASGNIIDDATGTLTGQWSGGSAVTTQMAGGVSTYSPATGPYVRWTSSTVLDGRIVKGRTFLVPTSTNSYGSDGTIVSSTLTVLQNAASALVSSHAGDLVLWHRPRKASAGVAARPGGHAVVTGATVPTKVGVLRSRRD
jgi:hypothetical protein